MYIYAKTFRHFSFFHILFLAYMQCLVGNKLGKFLPFSFFAKKQTKIVIYCEKKPKQCTGWSRWISPILEGYCGYFFLMIICFFGCILTVHQTHFVFSVQIFDIIKFLFSSQIGDNLRGTP